MRLFCLLLALGVTAASASGQEAAPLFVGFGAHVSVGRQFAVRFGVDSSVEFTLGADPTSVQALSVSGGVRVRRGKVHFGTYAGPAVVWGLDRFDIRRPSPQTREPHLTAGVALNGSAVVEVGGGIGLGVGVSGNLNSEVSTVGARLTTHVWLNRVR